MADLACSLSSLEDAAADPRGLAGALHSTGTPVGLLELAPELPDLSPSVVLAGAALPGPR